MSLTSELDAVNTLLRAIQAAPVASIDDPSVDVANARAVLTQTSREVQSQGWHWNSDTRYSLARSVDGEYVLPTTALRIDVSDDFPTVDVVDRGGRLWDKREHTFAFTVDLTFDVVWLLPFEQLPEAARNYITLRAGRRFQEKALGSSSLSQFDARDEVQALAILREAESDTEDNNILNGSWAVARVLYRTPTGF